MKVEVIKGIINSNTFVASEGGSVLIIESGAEVDKVLKALDGRKPNAILLTHEHYDHIFHISDYIKEFNCPIYCIV